MRLIGKSAYYSLIGLLVSSIGALLGTFLMMLRIVIGGNTAENIFTFGFLGVVFAWERNPRKTAIIGALIGGAAGFFHGLLRISSDPFLYPIVQGMWSLIYLLGNLLAALGYFFIGYMSAPRRRWLAGMATFLGWKLGSVLGAALMFGGRGGMDLTQILVDALGVGFGGGMAGLFLALTLVLFCRTDELGEKTPMQSNDDSHVSSRV